MDEIRPYGIAGMPRQRVGEQAERVQRLAQVVARRRQEPRLRPVRGLGILPGLLRFGQLELERSALCRNAPLEVRIEPFLLVEGTHEAIDQDPAQESQECEGRIGHEP